ncbi:hypothetical protein CMUS01_01303 [Colletotrichum musicola]|uniref:Uncharacterized protein n=1 Tax=Colletotrichum musicola TaxID=2175873 RepID=A0A8H6NXG6_9PEZI|nr:hypothetical protein CMUS01_01303 [Colletotrichum musicola]
MVALLLALSGASCIIRYQQPSYQGVNSARTQVCLEPAVSILVHIAFAPAPAPAAKTTPSVAETFTGCPRLLIVTCHDQVPALPPLAYTPQPLHRSSRDLLCCCTAAKYLAGLPAASSSLLSTRDPRSILETRICRPTDRIRARADTEQQRRILHLRTNRTSGTAVSRLPATHHGQVPNRALSVPVAVLFPLHKALRHIVAGRALSFSLCLPATLDTWTDGCGALIESRRRLACLSACHFTMVLESVGIPAISPATNPSSIVSRFLPSYDLGLGATLRHTALV